MHVRRLVERVVPRDPGIVAVVLGDGLPQVHHAILEVRVRPELRPLGGVVAVPVLVLRTGNRVQVEDRVDPVSGAGLHDPVEQPESLVLHHEWCAVVLEVAVVERECAGS